MIDRFLQYTLEDVQRICKISNCEKCIFAERNNSINYYVCAILDRCPANWRFEKSNK